MKLEIAIEILENASSGNDPWENLELKEATKLGIEALKRCQAAKVKGAIWDHRPLSGETADTDGGFREKFRDNITPAKDCALCQGDLDPNEEDRGFVEFTDGWFWICSKCRKLVGKTLDGTQCEKITEWEIPPYRKRSRKYWLKWLEDNFQIKIPQQK